MDGVQRNCRRDSDPCQHRNDHPSAGARPRLSVRARIRQVRTPYLWQLSFSGKTSMTEDIVLQQAGLKKLVADLSIRDLLPGVRFASWERISIVLSMIQD
jgi:hypothetical protein